MYLTHLLSLPDPEAFSFLSSTSNKTFQRFVNFQIKNRSPRPPKPKIERWQYMICSLIMLYCFCTLFVYKQRLRAVRDSEAE